MNTAIVLALLSGAPAIAQTRVVPIDVPLLPVATVGAAPASFAAPAPAVNLSLFAPILPLVPVLPWNVLPSPLAAGTGASEMSGRSRRYAPLLTDLVFAIDVAVEQRTLLNGSLSRRKAGWLRGLAKAGVDLSAGQPSVTVLSAETRVSRRDPAARSVTYVLEWKHSDTKLGRVRVSIDATKLEPAITSQPLPEPPKERQLVVRFVSQVPEAEVRALAQGLGLRVLRRSYQGDYALAAPDSTDMAKAEQGLSANPLVIDARSAVLDVPAQNQLRLAFKASAKDADVAAMLRRTGLHSLTVDYGVWTLGAPGADAAALARLIQRSGLAVYAAPAVSPAPESRRVVVTLRREASEDQAAEFLAHAGLGVLESLGGAYLLEVEGDNAAAAKALAAQPLVERAAAVGSLADDAVRASANGVASHKGRPWSQTEYNAAWAYAYDGLRREGATRAQLELFEKLTGEAPVLGGGFNPWSGD